MQYQFVRKKQTVHPAVPNSNTLVEASVAVYYSYRPGLLKSFGRDHISYCTTLRGPDNLRHVIFSGYVTFYQINTFFVKIFFIIGRMRFAAGWNGFAGRICPAGHSVENRDIDYEEEWWQHTPLSESNTNAERLWLTPSTRTQSFEQEYSHLTASKRHPSTPYSRNTLHSFSRGTRSYAFPQSIKHVLCISLWHAPRISRKFAGEWKFVL